MSKNINTNAWLKYAEEDLNVAELLLRSGYYRHALFWVEQASEKTLKVYLIAYLVKELDDILDRCKDLGMLNRHYDSPVLPPQLFHHLRTPVASLEQYLE